MMRDGLLRCLVLTGLSVSSNYRTNNTAGLRARLIAATQLGTNPPRRADTTESLFDTNTIPRTSSSLSSSLTLPTFDCLHLSLQNFHFHPCTLTSFPFPHHFHLKLPQTRAPDMPSSIHNNFCFIFLTAFALF